ncbi:gibberellin 2-beta-dioxygenase 8 [Aegilops tauschii subsp. strangulata]|uniref:Fe2OG dioxygenase domain-containing protein n=1 Tax=Aegilops tauschii subsp. strangulata TaxID=200361 RepID=A0A453GYJ8_AEGTS|nr:gibberellin 2-beta-dioxygenase 8 [Aegilops tauschii subsp. strangulata]
MQQQEIHLRRFMEHQPDECALEELELPTVDLEAEEPSLTEQLAAACRDPGVFRLVNHGVPCDLTARLFGLARGLLELDAANKSRLPGYFCGTPALAALPVKQLNWLEGLHVEADDTGDRSHSSADAADGEAGGSALAEFMEAVSGEYVAHMARIARKLFDTLACGELGLDEEQRASYLTERGCIFRAYRYPATASGAGRRQLGMEAHTDSSVLSILNQDRVGGLQVLYGGRWLAMRPMEGALVVNVGDMLQAMSGGAYRSPEHRVVAPGWTEVDRMSLCYFAFPQEDAVIVGPPSACRQEELYRAFSYREFREQVQADVKASGSKVGLARFRVPVSQS